MPEFTEGAIAISPEDVSGVEITFRVHQVGQFSFNIPASSGEDAGQFVRDLWTKMLDTYGPGGTAPAEMTIEGAEEEAVA